MPTLAQALGVGERPRVALVGSGGKTTAMFTLARELPPPVLVTTTTHLAPEQVRWADEHWVGPDPAGRVLPPEVRNRRPQGVCLLTGPEVQGRIAGLSPAALETVLSRRPFRDWPCLVEADGARRLPLKAPAAHEPVIPAWVEVVVTVAGLWGLGRPLDEGTVHRPARFAALSGLRPGAVVDVAALARVLMHPQGGLKGVRPGMRRVALLTGAETPLRAAQGLGVARRLLGAYERVVLVRREAGRHRVVAVQQRVAGVVLAAGAGRRMGRPKATLSWAGEPLVRRAARTALTAGLEPVVVVLGAEAAKARRALAGLPVQVVHNPRWAQGQGTSVAAGVAALPPTVGAAVFLLVDMPFTPPTLVRALVEEHARTLAPIVAPLVDGRRGNPVLFDRVTFADLRALQGDVGGRALFARYPLRYVPWHDPRVLWDWDRR